MAEPARHGDDQETEAAADSPDSAGAGEAKRRPGRRHPHWGRRKRRLRRAVFWLAAVGVAGTAAILVTHRLDRPQEWKPGEEDLPEITQNLSRGLPAEAPAPAFTDVTAAAGLAGFRAFAGQRSSQLPEDMGSGLAWGDFDNDGDDDLFVVAAGGALTADPTTWAPSKLYENLTNGPGGGQPGRFREVADFPDTRIIGMGAAWGDADGDGWLDLAVSGYDSLLLFHNDHGHLTLDRSFPSPGKGFWTGVAWGDFDGDRDLDLYVGGYVHYVEDPTAREKVSRQYGHAVPYTLNPVSYEPERNLLFENDGHGHFTEVAEKLGVANPQGRSLSVLWRDFDDDGRLDLYVANDVSDNAFYLNRSDGKHAAFEDAGLAAWVADYRGAMGLAAGDYNRDGDDDLFITHWIAQENALYDSLLADVRERDAKATAAGSRPGPALPAGVAFSDMAAPLGLGQVALRFVGWGAQLVDLDSDGWPDLVVADGSTFERKDDPTKLEPQVPMVLWNRRGEHFYDLAPSSKLLSVPHVGRGLAVADYDLDGDPDVAIVQLDGGVQLLRNDMGPHPGSKPAAGRGPHAADAHSLEIRLRSRTPDGALHGFGDGATVVARAGGATLRRQLTSASYLSQSSRTLHFGLGAAAGVDSVEVHWLGGGIDTYPALAAGALWELREGDPTPHRVRSFGAAPVRTAARADAAGAGSPGAFQVPDDPKARTLLFWRTERAAMDAIKQENDIPKATRLFREALALDPKHEDSHYYLAACLAAQGETDEALEHLRELARIDPQSHRAFKRWGTLEAEMARTPAELDEASRALEKALALNQEETGTLLVLGQVALMQGKTDLARQRLEWATTTNPKAVGGFYLRGYIAWKKGDAKAAADLLRQARTALGPEWKPAGVTAEGDVQKTMHVEETPLARFWKAWNGEPDPASAYEGLEEFLTHLQA